MTRLERYKQQLANLEYRRNQLMRSGQYVKSMMMNEEIQKARQLVKEAEEYEEACKPRPLKDIVSKKELDEMGIIPLMIECHLAADFLTMIAYEVVDICKAHGFESVQLMPDLKEIIKKSEGFAAFLTKIGPELGDLLLRNETFNQALHKRYVKYIEQRLK